MTLSGQQLERTAAIGTPVLVCSHRRSGTHLLLDLIRKHFPSTKPRLGRGESIFNLNVSIDRLRPGHHNPITTDRAIGMLSRVPRPLIQTHELPGSPDSPTTAARSSRGCAIAQRGSMCTATAATP